MPEYGIGQMAKAVGISTSAIRYYERQGLLKADYRSASNYRHYGRDALERLRFIRSAQTIGLSLQDIKDLLGLTDPNTAPCEEVQSRLRQRVAEIDGRISDLRQIKRRLKKALTTCCQSEEAGICGTLVQLGRNSKKSATRP